MSVICKKEIVKSYLKEKSFSLYVLDLYVHPSTSMNYAVEKALTNQL